MFLPCSAHSLNLCAVHAVKSSMAVKCFFGNIQKLYNFFTLEYVDTIKPLLVKRLREIFHSLQLLKEDFDLPGDLYNDVVALSAWLHSFEFAILATFWFMVLQAINDVSCLFQNTQLALDEEIRLIISLLNDLQRIQESWSVILEEARIVASSLDIEDSFKEKRQRKCKTFHDET